MKSIHIAIAGLLGVALIYVLNGNSQQPLKSSQATPAASVTTAKAAPPPPPCPYAEIDVDKYGKKPFVNPEEVRSVNGVLTTTLNVAYTEPATTTIGGCHLKLRTYNGKLVGPTLRVKPGDTMLIRLNNQLPPETAQQLAHQHSEEKQNNAVPNGFNVTNLHLHGLHVSPSGNSDNVLIAIQPQTAFDYEIKIPANHPPGSYWYHAHAHGSTAIQVGSGMAGAIVIEDDVRQIPPALAEANLHEQVLMFQTIAYDEYGRFDSMNATFPNAWQDSKRHITINGQLVPVITMRPGEVQRWRITDTAFRESLTLRLEGHELHEIALDGLYLGTVATWPYPETIDMATGYRNDLLVKASDKPGDYHLIDAPLAKTSKKALRKHDENEHLVAIVRIEGEPLLPMKLPKSADMAHLKPFTDIAPDEAKTTQLAEYFITGAVNPALGVPSMINYQEFDPSKPRQLKLNDTQKWQLSANGEAHVFHIHVNPFQYNQYPGPRDTTRIVWKDTLLVPQTESDPNTGKPTNLVEIYTRYLDYIGQTVMHCHILDHEDLGMMEVDQINN